MNKPLILVVEDDKAIRNLICTTLETHDYRYQVSVNGKEAIMQAASYNPDVIFLDLGLPDMDGVEVITKIRCWTSTPIIVISARSEDYDKIAALDAGADDYITKPFSVDELLARLRVSLRRVSATGNTNEKVFVNKDLSIDYIAGLAYLNEEELKLTPIEFKLLTILSKNVGRVITHSTLTKEVWGSTIEDDIASLRVFMATLRKKLGDSGNDNPFIQTHIGVGYRMNRK